MTIYRDNSIAFTAISNAFIDKYMIDANDAQLKVYLYLLRMFQSNQSTDISDMADLFNYTEKDILRSLKYWEKKKLLTLEFDSSKNLTSICLRSLDADEPVQKAEIVPLSSLKHTEKHGEKKIEESPLPEKPSYSLDDLKAFKNGEETEHLLFIVEQYIGKPLSVPEVKTILFIYDKLGFSTDLIDYLVEYCVERDKRDFRYIEKVALSWAENNISTPKQAKSFARKYDKAVYTVMKSLGKTTAPTPKEAAYIIRWTKDLGFSLPMIEIACEKTVMATDKHRFEYADSILSNWNRSHVHNIEDIRTADAAYQKNRSSQSRSSMSANQFNQFPQRDYDFDALEKELLSN